MLVILYKDFRKRVQTTDLYPKKPHPDTNVHPYTNTMQQHQTKVSKTSQPCNAVQNPTPDTMSATNIFLQYINL